MLRRGNIYAISEGFELMRRVGELKTSMMDLARQDVIERNSRLLPTFMRFNGLVMDHKV